MSLHVGILCNGLPGWSQFDLAGRPLFSHPTTATRMFDGADCQGSSPLVDGTKRCLESKPGFSPNAHQQTSWATARTLHEIDKLLIMTIAGMRRTATRFQRHRDVVNRGCVNLKTTDRQ